jgi:hypothetical protein
MTQRTASSAIAAMKKEGTPRRHDVMMRKNPARLLGRGFPVLDRLLA